MKKLTYISNARLPTEKAYGIQIAKMCEAFASLQITTDLKPQIATDTESRITADNGQIFTDNRSQEEYTKHQWRSETEDQWQSESEKIEVELVYPYRQNRIKDDFFDYYSVKKNFKLTKVTAPDFYWPGKLDKVAFLLKSFIASWILVLRTLTRNSDIFYSRDELPVFLWSFFINPSKIIFEAHRFSSKRKFFYKRFKNSGIKLVVISDAIKHSFLNYGFKADKLLVAHDGVDINEFNINISKDEARIKLELPTDKKIVMYTGHLYSWKGADILLEAAKIADTRRFNALPEHTPINAESELLYGDITYKIRGACFKVWRELRGAFKESVVERALLSELQNIGLKVKTQVRLPIIYEGKKVGEYVPDMLINDKVLIELKSKPVITKEDQKQFWLYLRGSSYKLGLLINFGRQLEIVRRIYDTARDTQRISAYREAENPRGSVLFVFVGGTESDLKQFRKKAEGLDNVLILGHRPYKEIPMFLKAADVLVLPNSSKDNISSYTSPLKLFEYMASGRPIVASSLPSIIEIINDNNAVLVDSDDPSDLTEGIYKLLNDDNYGNTLAQKARYDVGKYSWQERARKILTYVNF